MDGDGPDPELPVRHRWPSALAIAPLLILVSLVSLSTSIVALPLNRLLEQRLCRDHYAMHSDLPEKLCKLDGIQQALARIMGFLDTLQVTGDFLATIPLSFLAERYGRRTVLCLNLLPRFFVALWALVMGYLGDAIPPSAAVTASIPAIIGGGDTLFNSLVYSLAAEMTDDAIIRATYFSWMTAVSSVIGFLGPAIAALAMSASLLLPFWTAILLLLLAIPAVSLLPRLGPTGDEELLRPMMSSSNPSARRMDSRSRSVLLAVTVRLRELVATIKAQPRNLGFLLATFFFAAWASSDTKLLAQYISTRYKWGFQAAGYLLACKAVVNFVILTLLLPRILRARGPVSQSRAQTTWNISCARFCLVMSILGAIMIAVSWNIWLLLPGLLVYALGVPLSVFTLGLLKSSSIAAQVEDYASDPGGPNTHLFSIVMLTKTLGSLVGAPTMATAWVLGIRVALYGAPFFASSLIYLAAVWVFSKLRV
ncbi:major facilitator superfamily domain-containing protein [Xylariomycetidae sp. FL0641]|nr:major facilitator superfamily domain-containing protein [Xylariomycetidae sp. FL0641]